MNKKITEEISQFFLDSHDFNGIHISELSRRFPDGDLIDRVKSLIEGGSIDLNFGDRHPNPHIKAFESEAIPIQVQKLSNDFARNFCLYPSKTHLAKVVSSSFLKDEPFSRMMALGEPQLSFKSFRLETMEIYRNDPRYHFWCDDFQGHISVSNEFYESPELPASDHVLLETFGFSYSNSMLNRYLAAFLRYLKRLSPEHQAIWQAKIVSEDCFLHPMYAQMTMGDFIDDVSILSAILMELELINKICSKINLKPFFNDVPSNGTRPTGFYLLIRPTQEEFNYFVHALDKLFSDNINFEFFPGSIPRDYDERKKDGRIEIRRFGTIKLLERWLENFHFETPEVAEDMLKIFREIRSLRQKPAHKAQVNQFDQNFIKEQLKLAKKAYRCAKILRSIFQLLPGANKVEVPRSLALEKICPY